jgi:magnesium transporter
MLRVATRFLQHLKQIDKISIQLEKQLRKSMKNKELIQLLDLQKSLVYFSTSLKSDETTIEKMMRGRYIKMYEDDQDILEDVLIEIKQAVEMSNIYLNVLSGTMDAFASVISNNLNIVMKILASITIVISIPNIIAGFYGMNVSGLPFSQFFWFPVVLSVVLMAGVGYLLYKKDMF